MMDQIVLPADFNEHLEIPNAEDRLTEALVVGRRMLEAGVPLLPNPDHAAIFSDPPQTVAGPLKKLGYVAGWDARCYPSPVDGQDYINVPSGLPRHSAARRRGWFDYVAVVHPVDKGASQHMMSQGYGNPFIHHITWGLVPPLRGDLGELDYAGRLVSFMADTRERIAKALKQEPGTLILALHQTVVESAGFSDRVADWLGHLDEHEYQIETMQGGGFLLQFFVLTGGRIEVALRVDTQQTFNPKSVDKISKDEISAMQSD